MWLKDKFLDFKDRLQDRHMFSIILSTLGLLMLGGLYVYKVQLDYKQRVENAYNYSFYELLGYVENVETSLSKSMISNSTRQSAQNLSEVWRQANLAKTYLGQLPIANESLANTGKFLTQTSDFSYSLTRQTIDNLPLSKQQSDYMAQLYKYSNTLHKNLNVLAQQLGSGTTRWGELSKKGTQTFQKQNTKAPTGGFTDVEKNFKEYPGLIYDGPFSEHITSIKPKGLQGNDIKQAQAQSIAKKFIGENKIKEIKYTGESKGTFVTYNYEATLKNAKKGENINIGITKKGGSVLWMLYNKSIANSKIDIKKAKESAKAFLTQKGYTNMIDTYYISEDGTATINYAYKQGDVIIYPDLIKVKVARDTGEVVGFEAKGYINSHYIRNIKTPKVTMEQARTTISKNLKISASNLTIIPTEAKDEILAYEFKGKLDDREFLVYVNALTGKEEKILIIINTPNGILTM